MTWNDIVCTLYDKTEHDMERHDRFYSRYTVHPSFIHINSLILFFNIPTCNSKINTETESLKIALYNATFCICLTIQWS